MREIEFRGKLKSNGEWAYGNLNVKTNSVAIITPDDTMLGKYGQVIPETVGQYTGLTDKNGKKIYEGDIVQHGFLKYIITWNEKDVSFDFYTANRAAQCGFNAYTTDYFEVIGNVYEGEFYDSNDYIHDNPELLKGGAEK